MKLISCESCGVVLDTDNFSITDKDIYNSSIHEWEPSIICPCCKTKISYFDGSY